MNKKLEHTGFTIQVKLIDYVFEHKLVNEFRFFVILKIVSGSASRIRRNTPEWKKAFEAANISRPTRAKYIAKLKELNWIGENSRGLLYIRGWNNIKHSLNLRGKRGIVFSTSDLNNFRAFCFAASAGDVVARTKKYLDYLSKGANKKEARKLQIRKNKVGISVYRIQQKTGLSVREITKLKKEAKKEGYLSFTKRIETIYRPKKGGESASDIFELLTVFGAQRCWISYKKKTKKEKREQKRGYVPVECLKQRFADKVKVGLAFRKR